MRGQPSFRGMLQQGFFGRGGGVSGLGLQQGFSGGLSWVSVGGGGSVVGYNTVLIERICMK